MQTDITAPSLGVELCSYLSENDSFSVSNFFPSVRTPSPLCHCDHLSPVQSLSHVLLFGTPWFAALQASLLITNSWSLLKFMSIKSVMPSNHLILCCLLLPSRFPSIRVFSNESVLSTLQIFVSWLLKWLSYLSVSDRKKMCWFFFFLLLVTVLVL